MISGSPFGSIRSFKTNYAKAKNPTISIILGLLWTTLDYSAPERLGDYLLLNGVAKRLKCGPLPASCFALFRLFRWHRKILDILDTDYQQWIASLKKRYRQSQLKAAVKVNAELVSFYWSLGRDIAMMKPEEKWGQGFFETLSRDLRQSLPDAKGFSYRNLHYMRQFYELFPFLENMQQAVAQIGQKVISVENELVQQAVAQNGSEIAPQLVAQIVSIPWGHICLIMNRCGKDQRKALFYVNQTVLNNWSRAMLLNFIQSDLYARQGKAITNFARMSHFENDLHCRFY